MLIVLTRAPETNQTYEQSQTIFLSHPPTSHTHHDPTKHLAHLTSTSMSVHSVNQSMSHPAPPLAAAAALQAATMACVSCCSTLTKVGPVGPRTWAQAASSPRARWVGARTAKALQQKEGQKGQMYVVEKQRYILKGKEGGRGLSLCLASVHAINMHQSLQFPALSLG